MSSSSVSPIVEAASPEDFNAKCPYRNANSIYCTASTMRAAISKRQHEAYCSTENFDFCPVFLGKVLRGTRI